MDTGFRPFYSFASRRVVAAIVVCVFVITSMCASSLAQCTSCSPSNSGGGGIGGGGGGGGLAASGGDTAQRLRGEGSGKNTFRLDKESGQGGVKSEGDVLVNMQKLFRKIWLDPAQASAPKSELDEWFNPHSRDALIDFGTREREVTGGAGRMWAGSPNPSWFWGCTGACPDCEWPHPEHLTPTCCYKSTMAYAALVTDTNFKACCVRTEEENESMEEIACRHPRGDGWAGLFEYYFPTNAIGWEAQRATSMIAPDSKVKTCLDGSDKLMENSSWMAQAIQKMSQSGDGSVNAKVADALSGSKLRPKDESLRFSDSLQSGGLTMRVNFAHMDPAEREALAIQYCMHPKQFMKLMDSRGMSPSGKDRDTLQMPGTGGRTLADLQRIPMWANYCPNAVKLMTNPQETMMRVINRDQTPTNFQKGMVAWQADPLFCQKMNVMANPKGGEFLREGVLSKQGFTGMTEESVGYTCRVGSGQKGGFATRMVPLELHSTAPIDPRTLDHAIPFMIAAGYYMGEMYNGMHSMYKRFEPRPYTRSFNLFSGKKWAGGTPNELGQPCRTFEGKDFQNKNVSDQLYLSDVNHQPFSQDKIRAEGSDPNQPEFKRYDREWTDKQSDKFHNRNFDEKVLNYGAAFRVFATCPAGYVRWRGPHSEQFAAACGEENFGGKMR